MGRKKKTNIKIELKYSTKGEGKYKAYKMARATAGRARVMKHKKRKYKEKASKWYYKGY